ncbi:hypothetical protein BN946_scf184851.g72 [Trametes cinnabarina]|uniref:DUF7330 domain-containing protein n=1 Tax=Pycnoporus cinnabarinus TaxID=5643 RepID=A0A060SBM0_PYCCI|nr:hypothetical protein BN946_scf184851.g72 [Trametes cinnabarina]
MLPSPGFSGYLRNKRSKRNKRWGQGSPSDVHASFRTRHGAISLNLAAVAENGKTAVPPVSKGVQTGVLVSSRHGRINVNLFEIQPGRCIDLLVESRHGKIVILLPPTYEGPLMFQTRSAGSVTLLPAFAARARTLRANDKETILVCTPPSTPDAAPSGAGPSGQGYDEDGNRVLVRTRHGRIVVGVSGVDRIEDAQGGDGLFKKLGEILELGGRAFGQYVETRARLLEKRLA